MTEREIDASTALQSSAWSLVGRVLPALYTLVISVAAARELGPADMGRQSYVAWVGISLVLLANGAVPQAVVRFSAEAIGGGERERSRAIALWGLRVQAWAAALALLVMGVVAVERPELRTAWLLAGVTAAASVLQAVATSVLVGSQRWRPTTIVGLVTGAAGTAATLVVLAAGHGITGMFAVEAVTSVVALGWMAWLARSELPEAGARRATAPLGRLRRFALLSLVDAAISIVVWRRSEFFFLERWSTAEEIALYSIAFSLTAAVGLFPNSISAVLSPVAATWAGGGQMDRVRAGYSRALRLVCATSLLLAAAMVALGRPLLTTVYGENYTGAESIVVVFALFFPLVPVAALADSVIVGVGSVRLLLFSNLAGAIVDVAVAALTVPDHGAMGAAWANGAGVAVSAGLTALAASRLLRPFPMSWSWLVGPVLAGLAALVGVLPAERLGGPAGLLVGGATSAAAVALVCLLVPVVPVADADWVVQQARAVGGHRVGQAVGALTRPRFRLGQPDAVGGAVRAP